MDIFSGHSKTSVPATLAASKSWSEARELIYCSRLPLQHDSIEREVSKSINVNTLVLSTFAAACAKALVLGRIRFDSSPTTNVDPCTLPFRPCLDSTETTEREGCSRHLCRLIHRDG